MKILKVILRISYLSLIVLLAFTAIMPNWFDDSDVIHKQLLHRFTSGAELAMRERAKQKGIPYKEYKQKTEADRASRALLASQNVKLNVELDVAILKNDLNAISTAANRLSIGEIGPDRLLASIENGNTIIFKALYRNSILCNKPQTWPVGIYQFEKDVYKAVIQARNVEVLHAWYGMGCHNNKRELPIRIGKDLVTLNKSRNIFVLAEFEDYLLFVKQVIWESLKRDQDANAQIVFEHAISTLDKKNPEVTFLSRKQFDKALYGRPNFEISDDLFIYALARRHLLFAQSVLDYDPNYIKRNSLLFHARDEVCYTNFPKEHVVKDFDKNSHTLFSDYPPLCVREIGGFKRTDEEIRLQIVK